MEEKPSEACQILNALREIELLIKVADDIR
jgi:hypothetical protein